jgi:SAM-dependent methyltransferase
MHESSMIAMKNLLSKYAQSKGTLLDVGSMDLNGSYKSLIPFYYTYTGLDLEAGKNVDIVIKDLYHWPIEDNSYDIVISGQCLEHVENTHAWIKEVYRVCRPNGLAIIIAPWSCGEHRHPVDCWRIFPDGMRFLFEKVAGFSVIEIGRNEKGIFDLGDTWGVGIKPHN